MTKRKIDYIEVSIETNESNPKVWYGLCHFEKVRDAKKQLKHQIEDVGRDKKNLRIIKRTHIIEEEIINGN